MVYVIQLASRIRTERPDPARKLYVVGQLSSRTRHRVLAVAAPDKSLSTV